MQYYTKTNTGDAGVFYLGYWITKYFNWPFRIQSTDIGIDAEFELMDDSTHSLGLIIKAQVKTTINEIKDDFVVYINKEHINYWTSLIVPVVLFKVDLANQNIYFKVISSLDDIIRDKKGDWKINFSLANDLLTTSRKDELLERFKSVDVQNLYYYEDRVRLLIDDINPEIYDKDAYPIQKAKIDQANYYLSKIKKIKDLFPWKFGPVLDSRIEQYYDDIRIHSMNLERRVTELMYY